MGEAGMAPLQPLPRPASMITLDWTLHLHAPQTPFLRGIVEAHNPA